MSGTVIQAICPKCTEQHVTMACPTCGFTQLPHGLRAKSRQVTTAREVAGAAQDRRAQFDAIMAEYAAAHPGATDANTNVIDVTLWLSSRRDRAVSV